MDSSKTHKGASMVLESAIQPTDQLLNELFRNLLSPSPNALDWTGVGVCDSTTGGRTDSITGLTCSSLSDPMGLAAKVICTFYPTAETLWDSTR
ncbi:hypothetical protein PIB30_036920 [Stylosanthes scabra]|uniref:Uncharacterized protein n=1 Tax=Stylosanthes scabra TaxID=79078 RepID=A0ABU6RE30_9FABA|nr:hypothetical protein [Stylosanthes scabra]